MRSVGIDIGTFSVKVCVVNSTSKGLSLQHFYEKILIAQPGFDRDLEIIEFLRDQLKIYDAAQTRFAVAIRQDSISVRFKNFPFKDRIKIIKSLPFEMEEEIPFVAEETVFDGRIIQIVGVTSDVLAFAVPKDTLRKIIQLMNDSGISPSLVTPEGPAFGNLFEKWQEPAPTLPALPVLPEFSEELNFEEKSAQVAIHIGHSRTLVALLIEGRLFEVRSLLWGGKQILDAVAKRYDIPYSDAAKQVQTNSFILTSKEGASSDQMIYSDLIAKQVDELVRELRLTLIEFRAGRKCEISTVWMSGGVSRMQNLGAYLTQGLEVSVNRFNTLSQFKDIGFEKNSWNEAVSPVSVGLALEGLRKPRNPSINLLKDEFAQESKALKAFIHQWSSVAQYTVIFIILLFIYSSFRESASLSMNEEASQVMKDQAKNLAHLKGALANEASIKKYITAQKKIASDFKILSGLTSMNSALDLVKILSESTPARSALGIEVRRFEIVDSQVHLEGFINSASDLKKLEQAIKSTAINGKINSSSPSTKITSATGKTLFSYQFEMDRNAKRSKE
jgi:general secretion pathway protein L